MNKFHVAKIIRCYSDYKNETALVEKRIHLAELNSAQENHETVHKLIFCTFPN
jgi:hypothetical protein